MASEIGQVAYTEAKSLELGSESESSRIFLLELGGESTRSRLGLGSYKKNASKKGGREIEREREKRDSWKRTDNDMRSSRRALPSPWKKFSRRWPDYSYYSCVGEKVARRFTSDILFLSLSLLCSVSD